MYDMQITSYNANLCFYLFIFFLWINSQFTWLFNIQSHYQCVFYFKFENMYDLMIYDLILWFTIWSYDPRSHLPLTILWRISILTTLFTCILNSKISTNLGHSIFVSLWLFDLENLSDFFLLKVEPWYYDKYHLPKVIGFGLKFGVWLTSRD